MLVGVYEGIGGVFLGHGRLVTRVTVYVIMMPRGTLCTLVNPEARPPARVVQKLKGTVKALRNNPLIVLEHTGEIVYGCQVWWESVQRAPRGGG